MDFVPNYLEVYEDLTDLMDLDNNELNRYFLEGHLEPMIHAYDEEEMMVNENIFNNQDDLEICEEVLVLSQKLSQISTENENMKQYELEEFDELEEEEIFGADEEQRQQQSNSSVIKKKRRLSKTSNADSEHDDINSKKIKTTADILTSTDQDDTNENTDTDDGMNKKDKNQTPWFLSLTNQKFIQLTKKLYAIKTNHDRTDMSNSFTINDIQEIGLLIYRIAEINIQRQVTYVYYQSGTGTLREEDREAIVVDRRVWPKQVISAMVAKRLENGLTATAAAVTTITTTRLTAAEKTAIEADHIDCETLVSCRYQQMNEQMEDYEQQFYDKKNKLIGFTPSMEQILRNYIFQYGIKLLKLKRDQKIALLKYDYDDEIIRRQYLKELPTPYQTEIADRLYELKTQFEKAKRTLIEFKQCFVFDKLPNRYKSIVLMNDTMNSNDPQVMNKQKKLIRQKKLDLAVSHIYEAEQRYHQCRIRLDAEIALMHKNNLDLGQNKRMPSTMRHLIEQRLTNITNRWRDTYSFRMNYYLAFPYSHWDAMTTTMVNKNKQKNLSTHTNQQEQINMVNDSIQSTMIIHTDKYKFNEEQSQLLNRGPTYVPPCQMNVLSPSSLESTTDDILHKQYASLKHQLAWLFDKYRIDVAQHFTIQNEIFDKFKQCFSMARPTYIEQRAHYEMNLIRNIHQTIQTNNLILRRTADHMNTFYLGNRQEFEMKATDYLMKTNDYKLVMTLNEVGDMSVQQQQEQIQKQITKLVDSVNYSLRILRRRNDIDENLYQSLLTDSTKVKLSYLYFLPDVSKENDIRLVPIVTSKHNITYKIGQYLDRLLRPFVYEKMRSVLFRDEIECIERLNYYTNIDERLTPTTLFCTMKITNYFTLDSHENLIDLVCRFIHDNIVSNKLDKILLTTIKNLLQLYLYNNIFTYKNKIYKFTKSAPSTSPLMDTLSNIYLCMWQKQIVSEIQGKKELFGRYKDQVFFTWNYTDVELGRFLHSIIDNYPNVYSDINFGYNVQFCNASISNQNGHLYTSVYHDPTIQKYTLPYVIGHSKVNYSDWIRSALLRAACLCSIVDDFNEERIVIELTCLVNGYSYIFVESRIAHFYTYFHVDNMRYSFNQYIYGNASTFSNKLQQINDSGNLIRLNYLYEYGAKCQFNQEFQQIWQKYFSEHPNLNKEKIAISLTSKHIYSLNALLSQQHKS